MNFPNVKSLTIPEGKVKRILSGETVLWSAGGLPSDYQQVEYISAANTTAAYLDLGFAFNTAATIHMTIYMWSAVTAYSFGAAENSGKLRCMLTAPAASEGSLAYGSTGSAYIAVGLAAARNEYNELVLTLKKGLLRFENLTNGNAYEYTTQAEYTMTNNLYLFAQNYNGSPRYGTTRQISKFKYYDKNGDLICDLMPCYRKSDGVIGMYDLARRIFLTNAGSGSFTKGADV